MPIIKRDEGRVPYNLLNNPAVSARAKGLYSYLWSLGNGSQFTEVGMVAAFSDGRDGLRTATRELMEAGYLIKQERRAHNQTYTASLWILKTSSWHNSQQMEVAV